MSAINGVIYALSGAYQWSLKKPQAIVWGAFLFFGSLFGAGDLIMGLLGGAALVGGFIGLWRAMMTDEAE